MAHLARHRRDWDELAQFDPLWAVLTHRNKKGGGWDLADFFATGTREVAKILAETGRHGRPGERGRALDFGCGAGRLTRALGTAFAEVVGIDISDVMISRARELNAGCDNVHFRVSVGNDLASFESGSFDLVCSSLVLQHLPDTARAMRLVAEFIRVLRPSGIAVFQMPTWVPWLSRPVLRRRAYQVLRALGLDARTLIGTGRTNPMRMNAVPDEVMRSWVDAHGGVVVGTFPDVHTPPPRRSQCYLVVPAV